MVGTPSSTRVSIDAQVMCLCTGCHTQDILRHIMSQRMEAFMSHPCLCQVGQYVLNLLSDPHTFTCVCICLWLTARTPLPFSKLLTVLPTCFATRDLKLPKINGEREDFLHHSESGVEFCPFTMAQKPLTLS